MDKINALLKEIFRLHMHGPLNRDEYKKLDSLACEVAGEIEDDEKALKAAESDIAELLWLDGSCQHCAYGEELKHGGASRWVCTLDRGCCPKWRGVVPREEEPDEDEDEPVPESSPAPSKHLSRTERMFGAKEAWAARVDAEEEKNVEEPEQMPEIAEKVKTYQGFLLIRCGKCWNLHGFCAKSPLSEYRCRNCEGVTPLRKLTALYIRCKCGRKFTYRTNITEVAFSYTCLGCGAPVDVAYNNRKNAYMPL